MMIRMLIAAGLAATTASVSACQTGKVLQPAVLETADAATMAVVSDTLATAMNRASINLAGGDLTGQTSVSVLPPPLGPNETMSPAMPTVFDIMTNGEDCFLISREGGEIYKLDDVSCMAVEG